MKELIYIMGGRMFLQTMVFVYMSALAWGVWYVTEDVVAVAGTLFITVIYSVSVISRTIRIHLERADEEFKAMFMAGYNKALADIHNEVSKGESNEDD